ALPILRDRIEAVPGGAIGRAPPSPGEVRQAGELELPVRLLAELRAGLDFATPILSASRAVHRALSHDAGEEEVDQQVDLARLQRRWRIGQRQAARLELVELHPVAASVAVGEPVEGGHAAPRTPALDGEHEAFSP